MLVEVIRNIAKKLYTHEPDLYPEDVWDDTIEFRIERLDMSKLLQSVFAKSSAESSLNNYNISAAQSVKAGLYLWNESLNASHDLSQDIANPTGSYWHGLMHRMEGDYSNAKYWMRQTRAHPVFAVVQRRVTEWLPAMLATDPPLDSRMSDRLQQLAISADWQPELMIDLIEDQVRTVQNQQVDAILKRVQHIEFVALLEYSYTESFGGPLFDDYGNE